MYKLSKKCLYFPNFSVIVYVYTNLCNKLVKDKSYSFNFGQTVPRGAGSPWASLGSPEKSPTVLTFRLCLKSEKKQWRLCSRFCISHSASTFTINFAIIFVNDFGVEESWKKRNYKDESHQKGDDSRWEILVMTLRRVL